MSDVFYPHAMQAMERCEALAAITQTPGQVDRRYLTAEHLQANQLVASWMQDAGMTTWVDQAGNQWGRYASAQDDAPIVVLGSHLDTVPNGGKYDGILGVVAPLCLVDYLNQHQVRLPFHLEIVGFGDEEGTRYGSTLLGSRAIAGTWVDSWSELTDHEGQTLAQAMHEFGLDIDQVTQATRTNIQSFVELHIEQGPVLESEDLALGVVSAIAGAQRFEITLKGHAGHAGTVPMAVRHDPLVCASRMIQHISELANQSDNVVATVGKITCLPGAVNVIPGKVTFSLDVRSPYDDERALFVEVLLKSLDDMAQQDKLVLGIQQTHQAEAVQCSDGLQGQLNSALHALDLPAKTLFSGAGHDTMAMAHCCDAAMLFMRCHKGISHHPDEAVRIDDVACALAALHHFVTHYQVNG